MRVSVHARIVASARGVGTAFRGTLSPLPPADAVTGNVQRPPALSAQPPVHEVLPELPCRAYRASVTPPGRVVFLQRYDRGQLVAEQVLRVAQKDVRKKQQKKEGKKKGAPARGSVSDGLQWSWACVNIPRGRWDARRQSWQSTAC